MKRFDGREKSILRAATRALLPDSIAERQKSPYPSTQHPAYETAIRQQVADVLADSAHPAAPLLDSGRVKEVLARPVANASLLSERVGLERVRSLATWFKDYGVSLTT
jgi:asparagine synthase (glutamine-hydrolysing)